MSITSQEKPLMKVKPDEETGEGNREADRRYRQGMRETIESTDADERAEQARDISDKDLNEARAAEDDVRSRARK
jgi:hypothetical protein